MKIKFYHNVGSVVTLKRDLLLWEVKKLSKGDKFIVNSVNFSNNMTNYTLNGCGSVGFQDCDFEVGTQLMEYNTDTQTISL